MYNLGNDAYKVVPVQQASYETWLDVAKFIAKEFKRRSPSYVRLVMHGGEPMLVKAGVMEKNLSGFWAFLEDQLETSQLDLIQLSMQTNAMLVTDDWIALIKRWRIGVGFSIDGPKNINDEYRLDKRGNGTFDRVVSGYRKMCEGGIPFLGALCVINPLADGAIVYKFLAHELKLKGFNFLLPFMNWDNYDGEVVDGVGQFLCAAFREWAHDLSKGNYVDVRVFREALQTFIHPIEIEDEVLNVSHNVVVVECDGSIMTEESLRPTYKGVFSSFNIRDSGLEKILDSPQFLEVDTDKYTIAQECSGCGLLKSCKSGQTLGRVGMRYSSVSNEMRKSVYCEAFVQLFVEVAALLNANKITLSSFDFGQQERMETLG